MALVSAVVALLGCASRTSDPGPRGLVIALDAEPQSLDPRFGSDASSSRLADLLHVGLTRSDAAAQRRPALAMSWEFRDPTTLVFRLRPDFRFAGGQPVTADDVRATYEAVLDPATGSPKRAAIAMLSAVEAPDPTTVVMRLTAPSPPFLDATGLGILPAARARSREEVTEGAGPFRLVGGEPGERVVLAPNPGYPDGPAALDPLVFRIVPDPLVRVLELQRGGIQFLQDQPEGELLDWLRAVPALAVHQRPGTSFAYLGLNLRDPRLADRRVRAAIALALDRPALIRWVLGGTARPATGLLSPEHWAYATAPAWTHDPARAARLLDLAGLPDPDGAGPAPRFRIVYKTSTQPARRRLAEAIQAQLAAVGIAVDVRTYEWGTLFADIRAGRFEMTAMTWVGIGDPDIYRQTLHSQMAPPSGWNRGYYDSPVMDRLTTAARAEADPARRRRLYARIQRRAAHDLPVVPLWWEDRVVVHARRLVGFEPTPSGDLLALAGAHMTD